MKPAVELAIKDAVRVSMGIYPASVLEADGTRTERTPWQDGWNAYAIELLERTISAKTWFNCLNEERQQKVGEMLESGDFDVKLVDGKCVLSFNTSDLFAWAYSDYEEITEDIFDDAYEAWKNGGYDGMLIWHCKRQNQKPHWPQEVLWRKSNLWDDKLEVLPDNKYDAKLRWKSRSRLEAVKELEKDSK